jgi:hypothetical protein
MSAMSFFPRLQSLLSLRAHSFSSQSALGATFSEFFAKNFAILIDLSIFPCRMFRWDMCAETKMPVTAMSATMNAVATTMQWRIVAVLMSVSACHVATRPEIRKTRQIRFQLGLELGGLTQDIPWLWVTVRGVRTKAIIDTGADVSVLLADSFPARPQFPTMPGIAGADATGERLELRQLTDTTIAIEGLGDVPGAIAVLDGGNMFVEAGVGLVISPQAWTFEGWQVRIDMRRHTLVLESTTTTAPSGVAADVCEMQDGGFSGRHYQLPVAISGSAAVLTIDTGSSVTDLSNDATAAVTALKNTKSRRETTVTQSASGTDVESLLLHGLEVGIGGVVSHQTVHFRSLGTQSKICPVDGRIGTNALKNCSILLRTDLASVICDHR